MYHFEKKKFFYSERSLKKKLPYGEKVWLV